MRARVFFLSIVAFTVACGPPRHLSPEARAAIGAWLECDDCLGSEFALARTAADSDRADAVPLLAHALFTGANWDGRLPHYRSQLEQAFDSDTAYARAQGMTLSGLSRRTFVDAYLARAGRNVRLRAAVLLGWLDCDPVLNAARDSARAGVAPRELDSLVLRFARDSLPPVP